MIVLSSFVPAMCLALVIFLTRPLHIQFTAKGHGNAAVQSSHRLPTPRIGGLAVILGGCLGAFTLDATTFNLVSILATSALPVFWVVWARMLGLMSARKCGWFCPLSLL